MADLGRIEAVVDASEVAPTIEAKLPIGVRSRQLSVRTLLVGMLVALDDGRPAHLTRVHTALVSLEETDRRRLGVTVDWRRGTHTLTYRQVERTFSLVTGALVKEHPDGAPSEALQEVLDALVEASVPDTVKNASRALAVDWTDVESFSTRRTKPTGTYADTEAAWGHRKGGGPGEKDELFFGYYLSLATMVKDESNEEVPELVRRMHLCSCDHDPVPQMVDVLVTMPRAGIPLGDVLCDSGYAHRVPEHFALPLRRAGASLVMDLHPHDRGTQGTHQGADLVEREPLLPDDAQGPLRPRAARQRGPARKRPAPTTGAAPSSPATSSAGSEPTTPTATTGCRARPSWASSAARCGRTRWRSTTRTRGPRPSRAPAVMLCPADDHRRARRSTPRRPSATTTRPRPGARSYARRSAAERSNARIKDPATIDVARGWCRVMGAGPHEPLPRLCPRRAQPGRRRRVQRAPARRPTPAGQRPAAGDPAASTDHVGRAGRGTERRISVRSY